MPDIGSTKFGATVRRGREGQKITLRKFAAKIGVSPTYLSKIERDEFPPPAEDKVRAIARIIDLDSDELLALAGRVSTDVQEIIRQRPRELASFLRATQEWTAEDLARLTKQEKPDREE